MKLVGVEFLLIMANMFPCTHLRIIELDKIYPHVTGTELWQGQLHGLEICSVTKGLSQKGPEHGGLMLYCHCLEIHNHF